MKLFLFYVLILGPILLHVLFAREALSPGISLTLVFLYVFVYHPTLVALRLLDKRVITKADFTKTYIPFWNHRYFSEIFF